MCCTVLYKHKSVLVVLNSVSVLYREQEDKNNPSWPIVVEGDASCTSPYKVCEWGEHSLANI